MQTATWSRSHRGKAWGALAVLTCLVLATSAGLALGRTRSCAQISNCATRVVAPPPPQSTVGSAPSTGHFDVVVRTPPASTLTTGRLPGTLIARPQPAVHLKCRGYQLKDPTPLVFMLKTATPVNITYEITDRLTNTKPDSVHFCLAATAPFRTLSHRPAATTTLPDGTSGHIGLLPNCPKPLPPAGATTAPCVASVLPVPDSHSRTKVDVIMKVRVPTRTKGTTQGTTQALDPWGGG